MRSEWVSKLTLIQQAEMAIVSAHNSKQTELRCEVFLWIQIILSFFYLSNFLLWFALQYSLHISAARPICYHTLHAHHNLVHRYLLILRLYIIIHARKEESNYFWVFFQSLLETRPSSLPPCKLFYIFDTSNTSYSNPVFFSAEAFKSVFGTQSPQGRHQQLRDLSAPGHHEPGTGVELTPALLVSWLWLYCAV